MTVALWGALGLFVGALLNHLADRLPGHERLAPGPACRACATPYPKRQWVALLALATGWRRCTTCAVALPRRRWLFELALALAFALLAWKRGLSWHLPLVSFHLATLALLAVTDLETRLVPDAALLPAAALALVAAAVQGLAALKPMLLGGAIGLGLFFVLWACYPKGMGFGDVKLAGYVGLIAGFPLVVPSLLVAILAGGLAAGVLLVTRLVGRRTYIPYAPFLVLGGILALFFG